MRRFWVLLLVTSAMAVSPAMVAAQGATATAPAAGSKGSKATPRTIEIEGTDEMKFSVTTITAKPGETLRVRLKAVSKANLPKAVMAHNFVLFKAAATPKQLNDFMMITVTKGAVTFIPPEMKALVIASTLMAGAGETVDVTFTVPTAPGSYPYLCSFSTHYLIGMKGTLVVK